MESGPIQILLFSTENAKRMSDGEKISLEGRLKGNLGSIEDWSRNGEDKKSDLRTSLQTLNDYEMRFYQNE